MRIFKGIAASEGMVKGKALVFRRASMAAERRHILADGVSRELKTLEKALDEARHTIEAHDQSQLPDESQQISEAHLLMLSDRVSQSVEAYIRTNLVSGPRPSGGERTVRLLLAESGDALLKSVPTISGTSHLPPRSGQGAQAERRLRH